MHNEIADRAAWRCTGEPSESLSAGVDCEIGEGVEIPLGVDREQHSTDRGEAKMLGMLRGHERRWSDMRWDSEQAI